MSERWESSIEPWSPPEGFVNPVPPGRGDPKPGRARPRPYAPPVSAASVAAPPPAASGDWTASTPETSDEAVETVNRKLKTGFWFIVVAVVLITQLAPAVTDLLESAKDRVEREIDDQTGSAGTLAADGTSDLPGGYASVSFRSNENIIEGFERKSIDNPYDGSTWTLDDDGVGWAMLGYYTFIPPNTTETERRAFIDYKKAEHERMAGHPIRTRRTRVDGVPAYDYDYRYQGEHRHVTWVLGDVDSYTLRCNAKQRSFERQCTTMRRTLSISR